jgi:hypothetical protein
VQLRSKSGTTLESKKVVVEARDRECTTSIGVKVSCPTTERAFCFEGKPHGHYELAFVLSKNGVPQPAIKFPTKYSPTRHKSCDAVYMVQPICPTAERNWR